MQIQTTRFGVVDIETEDILRFGAGLVGLEDCRQWVLLADQCAPALAWLQCIHRPEIALAVVSPRRFVPGYQLRAGSADIAPLQLPKVSQAQVLVIMGQHDGELTLNLKAPIVLNLQNRSGRQVINNLDEPVAYRIHHDAMPLRRSA